MTLPMLRRVLLALAFLSGSAQAQTTAASVSGTVTDPAGGLVAQAKVMARNIATGVVSNVLTNDSGVYVFGTLQPGTYQISVEHPGFQKYVLDDLELDVGARLGLNLELKVGAVVDTVEVKADAAQQVGYLTSSVGAVVNGRKVLELPLAGRNAVDLLRTQAGVSGANGGQNFNGARVGSLNITVDGTNASSHRPPTRSWAAARDRSWRSRAPAAINFTAASSTSIATARSTPTIFSTTSAGSRAIA